MVSGHQFISTYTSHVFFDNPDLTFSSQRVYSLFKSASIAFTEESQIINRLLECLEKADTYHSQRKNVAEFFQNNPGDATQAYLNYVKKTR